MTSLHYKEYLPTARFDPSSYEKDLLDLGYEKTKVLRFLARRDLHSARGLLETRLPLVEKARKGRYTSLRISWKGKNPSEHLHIALAGLC
jgi:hypothetical protein